MPRYFISVLNDTSLTVDREGLILPDLDAARSEALRGGADIMADELKADRLAIHLTLMIESDDRERLADVTLTARAAISEGPFLA